MNALLMIAALLGATTNYNLSRSQEKENETLLSAEPVNVACVNASQTDDPTCASFELQTYGVHKVTLYIDYTNSTATKLELGISGNHDAAAPWYEVQGGGNIELPDVPLGPHRPYWSSTVATFPTTGNTESYLVTFFVNSPFTRVRIWATGGAVGDVVTVRATKTGQ